VSNPGLSDFFRARGKRPFLQAPQKLAWENHSAAFSSCYLFNRLTEPQLKSVLAISQEQNIQKEQWLFRENEEAHYFYLIKKGAVELLTVVDERIEIPIAMVRTKNGCIGIGALVPPYRYSLSARAADDSNLLVFERTDLERLKKDDPGLVCIIMNNLAQKLLERLRESRQEIKIHFMRLVRAASF